MAVEKSSASAALLAEFFAFLSENTDIFDPVMVRMQLDAGLPLRLSGEERAELVSRFLEGEDTGGHEDDRGLNL